ncbi:MAG: carbohydrate porin [Pseudomonadota bacterium]
MLKHSLLAAAVAAAFAAPMASAADSKELKEIRAQIRQMKDSYEARLQALEQRLEKAQVATAEAQAQTKALAASVAAAPVAPGAGSTNAGNVASGADAPLASAGNTAATMPAATASPASAGGAAAPASNLFNPNISMILGGTMQNLSQDPGQYRLQGFVPSGGEGGPGSRGFSLGESELTMAANIDPQFAGQLTFALGADNTVSVEEAFVQTRAMSNGLNLKAGRFLSALGYMNGQHAHTWDFVDAPLAYQAFLGGQYKPDGVQAKWLAPLDQYLEVGVELGNGSAFPGTARNKNGNGATTVFAHLGDDIGDSASYRVGLSHLRTGAHERAFEDGGLNNAFSGNSRTWVADGIFKWAPNGNPTQTNFKLQGEYFRRHESGQLAVDSGGENAASGSYASTQSGWYLQSVYQFKPNWRAGLRYDRLSSGSQRIGLVDDGTVSLASLPILEAYTPSRSSVMFDYSPSEFSRLRLQLARDKSRPGVTDNQIFLQYIMSLGTHAAHAF